MKKICVFLFLMLLSSCLGASLDEMIGQKIIIGFGKTMDFERVLKYAKNGEIGGVIFFERDIKNSENLKEKIDKLSKYNLFIATDQEGGYVQRMNSKNGFTDYLSESAVASEPPQLAYRYYSKMAGELKENGFNLNFVPCLDLVKDKNSIIGKKERGFSNKPDVVTFFAREEIKAHADNGIITSMKHFPGGHGSVIGDTHKGFVDVTDYWGEDELIPYKNLANENCLQTVMVAHVFNRKIDDRYPASLSKKTVAILRSFFDGVVITDDLDMGAIKNNYNIDDTILNTINADEDIMLFSGFWSYYPIEPKEIRKIIKQGIKDKRITKGQIKKSYKRIKKLKANLNTF